MYDLKPKQRDALLDADRGPLNRACGGYRGENATHGVRAVNALERMGFLQLNALRDRAEITRDGQQCVDALIADDNTSQAFA